MNMMNLLWLVLSAAFINVILYYFFKRYLIKTANPGILFMMINIFKDVVWVIYWLKTLEMNRTNFLILIGVFLVASFFLYFKIIRLINRS